LLTITNDSSIRLACWYVNDSRNVG
jgi:hypothetical protein